MKVFLAISILFLFAVSCNNDQQSGNKSETQSEKPRPDHNEGTHILELNNGAKWKADSVTNNNVQDLQAIVIEFNNSTDRSLKNYHSTAIELQAGLDKMVRECKMKGPDHDALHRWLEPLISRITKLKKAANEQEGDAAMKETEEQIKLFTRYFEP